MESYMHTMDNQQPLDFTSFSKRELHHVEQTVEPPILDLSCKKDMNLTSSEVTETSFESRPSSPASTEPKSNQFSDSERKSPFEGRTFMVTPPSESDSPKKIKYEPIYNHTDVQSSSVIINQHHGFSHLPVNVPISVAPTVLPTLLTTSPVPVKQIAIPSASSNFTATTAANLRDVGLLSEVGKKAPRPFKAYPKDPLSLTVGTAELIYDQNSNEAYSEFRKRMLESVRRTNEGTNVKMRRVTKSPGLPTSTVEEKDAAYWERRRKNNEAAKRSRDARRAKEDEIAIRAAFLEQENMKLKYELVALRNETAKLRCMVYST